LTVFDEETRARLEDLIEQVAGIAEGDFVPRGRISDRHDEIDAVVASLNVLAEDFGVERARRERAELQLRDAADGYENAPALFCSVEPRSPWIVVQANATLLRSLGIERKGVIGQPLSSLYVRSANAVEQLRDCLAAVIDKRAPPSVDHLLLRRGGEPITALLSGSVVVDGNGAPQRLRLIYRDVTEERRLESQLIQAQKMEGLGQLAGGVAHDFNNLLTAVFGAVEMMRERVGDDEDLEQIEAAARRAADLTSQLLAFSRRTVMAPSSTDINERLQNVRRLLERTLGADISIETRLASGVWTVVVDPARFEQVVMNLAVNARDAMPRGGRLSLRTENVELDAATIARQGLEVAPGAYVHVEVSDTGTGMPRDVVDRIFEPFFTTKEVGKGTGLGLAMVYGIVRQAGGGVSVSSVEGQGTSFHLYLARSQSAAEVEAQATAAIKRGGNETILLVEDDAVVRSLLLRSLRQAGYTVLEAASGVAALDVARRHERAADLVITDVVMPQLGGRDLIDQLQREGLLARVLFISGYTARNVLHGDDQTASMLQKPFSPSALLQKVRALLDEAPRTLQATAPSSTTSS
jgi:two-component system cell cycle sensor histidine kinase/response regulator CckA